MKEGEIARGELGVRWRRKREEGEIEINRGIRRERKRGKEIEKEKDRERQMDRKSSTLFCQRDPSTA